MIYIYFLAFIFGANAAIVPLTDLLPPPYSDPCSCNPVELKENARLKVLYVPDNLEKRFDDGSNKSPPAPVTIANSPYGPVPAGSEIEGQYVADNIEKTYDPGLYVPDNIEKQFDDGLYKIGSNNPETEESAKLKGLYVPDNLEKRFDDGSDKSPPAPVPIANSPYGPVPAGSGLEGQYVADNIEKMYDPGLYVPDNIEKRFDDGLYKIVNDNPETEESAKFKGLYVPDNLEKRFDDGSDKSPPAPVPLANSPYGPVPAGSGLEGQYVDSHIEKQFDDGLYKGDITPDPNLIDSSFESALEERGVLDPYAQGKQLNSIGAEHEILPVQTTSTAALPRGLIPAGVGLIPGG